MWISDDAAGLARLLELPAEKGNSAGDPVAVSRGVDAEAQRLRGAFASSSASSCLSAGVVFNDLLGRNRSGT